jgi:hypothetical protein
MNINIGDRVELKCGFLKKKIKEGIVEDIEVYETYDSDIEHTIVRLDNGRKIKVVTQNGNSFLQPNKIIEILD